MSDRGSYGREILAIFYFKCWQNWRFIGKLWRSILHIYTGWLVTGGTSGKRVILREKRSRKYRIKIFHLRLCFRENRLWIFARYACTLSRLVITDLTVDRCLDWRYVDKNFQLSILKKSQVASNWKKKIL